MNKFGIWSALVLLAFSASQVQARSSIQQEIEVEAAKAEAAAPSGPTGYTNTNTVRVVKTAPVATKQGPLIQLEPKFGMSFSTFKGASGNYSFSTTSGYEGGIGVLVGRGALQFETGIMYAERGAKETYKQSYNSLNATSWDLTYNNKYVEIPAMVRWNILKNSDTRIFVKGGAVMAVLQDSTGQMSNTQNYNYSTSGAAYYGVNTASSLATNNSTKDYFASTDVRWSAGLGGQIRLTQLLTWTLEADYQSSINKVSSSQPNGYFGSTDMGLQTDTYGIRTGIAFSL